ncbi:MAG TPA: hypothetical protein VLW45_09840, partial [Pelomicrobium sp.]|nr:hypothetical protein [Pelomicrobium sp.]
MAAPARSPRRRWPWLLAAAVLLPLVAAAIWSTTEHALVTTAGALERASGGRVELSGVSGTLY